MHLLLLSSRLTSELPQKPVPRKATGSALATVKKHSKDSGMKLYAACFW